MSESTNTAYSVESAVLSTNDVYSDGSVATTSTGSNCKNFWKTHYKIFAVALAAVIALFAGLMIGSFQTTPTNIVDHRTEYAQSPEIAILAFNDIYEMIPVGGMGGISRLQTVKNKLLEQYGKEKTLTILAGDFFSPSALGIAEIFDTQTNTTYNMAGKQMVSCMNHLGQDMATYGNHEFDISRTDFLARVAESEFPYISGNVRLVDSDQPIPNTLPYIVKELGGIKVLFVGLSIDSEKGNYADIDDYSTALRDLRILLDNLTATAVEYDYLIALTHLAVDNDVNLADSIPEIGLIIGGHEHYNMLLMQGKTRITKADSNIKSAYVHTLKVDPSKLVNTTSRYNTAYYNKGYVTLDSELVFLHPSIPEDPNMMKVVNAWWGLGKSAFAKQGIEIDNIAAYQPESYDLRDQTVRGMTGDNALFMQFIVDGMYTRTKSEVDIPDRVDAMVLNSGSVRVDEILPEGPLTEYDVLRILPFPGNMVLAQVSGQQLLQALATGTRKPGSGSWLTYQQTKIRLENSIWEIALYDIWEPIHKDKTYNILSTSYVMLHKGDNLFPEVEKILYSSQASQQIAVRDYLGELFPRKTEFKHPLREAPYRLVNIN